MIIPTGTNLEQIDYDLSTLSTVQQARINEIVGLPDFLFAAIAGSPGLRRPGPYTFLWWTTDDSCCAERIGVNRILRKIYRKRVEVQS